MGFALRFGERDFPLGQGRFTIGRAETSLLCLDDPMASRNHAIVAVRDGAVVVEDLKSRNGVYVNEERIEGPVTLSHGDVIRVGGQEMTLIRRAAVRAETLAQRPVTARLQAFGVLGSLADKAIALGRGDEAERILGRLLDGFLIKAEEGNALTDEEFEKASNYAYQIATLTKKGKWLDYVFRLHGAHERLMEGEMVNHLYDSIGKLNGATRTRLRDYVASLQEAATGYAPGEKFVLKRIEGLEALIS